MLGLPDQARRYQSVQYRCRDDLHDAARHNDPNDP
jgi:hypothetical protein